MLWKEQGVTVLAVAAVYDVFVFHRMKLQQVPTFVFKVKTFMDKRVCVCLRLPRTSGLHLLNGLASG